MKSVWEDAVKGFDVGGRPTDLEQIALTFLAEISVLYPSGPPPEQVTLRLSALSEKLKSAEAAIVDFAKFMIEETKVRNGGG